MLGTKAAPSSVTIPRRPGWRSKTPSSTREPIHFSTSWCSAIMSLPRTFSAPPSQSVGKGRPLSIHAGGTWMAAPPTWMAKGTPASASTAHTGSRSTWPGERSPAG